MTAASRIAVALLAVLLLGAGDPGLVLELDRAQFVITTRDLRDGSEGPTLPVALGSPFSATPPGDFPLREVVYNPAWHPGPEASAAGADPEPPSPSGPMGVAKIPFADGGMVALHGGADPRVLGKRVSLGCVRTADEDMLTLLAWLGDHGALAADAPTTGGEEHRLLRRPARLIVR
jgi:hypothetical protein